MALIPRVLQKNSREKFVRFPIFTRIDPGSRVHTMASPLFPRELSGFSDPGQKSAPSHRPELSDPTYVVNSRHWSRRSTQTAPQRHTARFRLEPELCEGEGDVLASSLGGSPTAVDTSHPRRTFQFQRDPKPCRRVACFSSVHCMAMRIG